MDPVATSNSPNKLLRDVRLWAAVAAAVTVTMVGLLALGRSHTPLRSRHRHDSPRPAVMAEPQFGAAPLPLKLDRAARESLLLDHYKGRILAWRHLPEYLDRITQQVAPNVDSACRQAAAGEMFAAMARDQRDSLNEARERWERLQEADLLLESFGDPDALSPSKAAGVAQWMVDSARGAGLSVDLARSNRLTAEIFRVSNELGWMRYLSNPNADRSVYGCPNVPTPDAQAAITGLEQRLAALRAQRQVCDARYVPALAIAAQTHYLLHLYPRFPSPDWLFQAYHGGEGSVTRTLRTYCPGPWRGTSQAIRTGAGGRMLRFEDVYFAIRPEEHASTFDYLYGRSDDHRHYWWKLRACAEVIALYRRDKAEFTREWEAHLPGRPQEAIWYPTAQNYSLINSEDLADAVGEKRVEPILATKAYEAVQAPLAPPPDTMHAALRPEARGLLALIGQTYVAAGGSQPLDVGDMLLSVDDVKAIKDRMPPPRVPVPPDPDAGTTPGGGPPGDFDYHTTGLAFDIFKPRSHSDAHLLAYTLDYLTERGILTHADRADARLPRSHVVPNPEFGAALAEIDKEGKTPALPGF